MFLPNIPRLDAAHLSHLLQVQLPSGSVAASEIIDGYGDHQRKVAEMSGGKQADRRFLIKQIATEFVDSLRTPEPIRQIEFIGHSDLVRTSKGRNVADEQAVSVARARDVRGEFINAAVFGSGQITFNQLVEAIDDGKIVIITVGVGARFPLAVSTSGPVERNRRVEIRLRLKQSVRI